MKKRILVIDGSKAIRFLLQTVLGKKYQVNTAPDGSSGMYQVSQKNLPDLIIADAQLPDMDDWELITYLTSSCLYGHIPVAVLSSLPKKETQFKTRELGARQFFIKPFNPVELVNYVDALILNSVLIEDATLKFV